ncbi:Uncharacterised protein family UPF0276 like protein, partial [Aduncisulcus paluster]
VLLGAVISTSTMAYADSHGSKCGAGKCGGEAKKEMKSAKCGAGKCGGEAKKEMKSAKCGAGKCGGDMKKKEMKSAKCGAGKCGSNKAMKHIKGCGLGLRTEFLDDIHFDKKSFSPDWWEVTPENWINMPIWYREKFEQIAEHTPFVAHGHMNCYLCH